MISIFYTIYICVFIARAHGLYSEKATAFGIIKTYKIYNVYRHRTLAVGSTLVGL